MLVTTVRDARITESSGLAVSAARPDVVWTVNDSGSAAVVYGVSLRTGRTVGTLRLVDASGRPSDVVDTESLASAVASDGRRSLIVGDIGDNRRVRSTVTLIRVPEPAQVRDDTVRTTRLRLRYADGPADAEALVATPDGRLLVITKALLRADVYEVPPAAARALLAGHPPSGTVTARRVTAIGETLVTGADALPDGRIVVRGYGSATLYGWDGPDLVAEQALTLPDQQQGESIAVEDGGRTALVSSEGVQQPLWQVRIPAKPPVPQPTSTSSSTSSQPAVTTVAARPPRRPAASDGLSLALPAWGVAGVATAVALAAAGLRAARRRTRRTR